MEILPIFILTLLSCCHFCDPTNDRGGTSSGLILASGGDDGLVLRNRRPGHFSSSSDTIVFPNGTNGPEDNTEDSERIFTKHKKIPLKFLRELSSEFNVSNVFEKYVQNVKVKDVKGHTFLVNLQGQPIDGGVGVVEPPVVTTAIPPSFSVFGPSSLGGQRPVAQLPDRRVIPASTHPSGGGKPISVITRVNTFALRPTPEPTTTERIAQGSFSLSSSFSEGGNAIIEKITKPAVCEPELKTVEVIPGPSDPGIIYFPSCVRIPQCGGCCISNLLTCDPVAFKSVEVQIQKLLYKTDSELEYVGTEKITMKAHTQCKCACRVKSDACSGSHYHDPDQCQCICRNQNESQACHSQELKLWNPSNCKCECREAKDCNSGYVFNHDTCTCKPEVKAHATDTRNRSRRDPQQSRQNAGNLNIRNKYNRRQ